MKRKKIILMLVIACIVALVTAFSLPLQAASSLTNSDFSGMYGAHLNYETNITENPDGSYTVVTDMYTSYAVTKDNINLVASEDGYYTVERSGKYLVEIWGGDGATASGKGGAGGYVYGVIDLSVGDTLYYTLGGGGQTSNTTGFGGGANGGGHHGENGSTTIGGGGGYSALFLFDEDYFKGHYLDENDNFIGNISEADRISKYVMIAGGGGGGGSYGQDSNGTSDGGAGGYIGNTSGILGAGYDVEGTFFSGLSGSSTGTSSEYTGKGGSNVPGKVVSTMLGWGKGDSPNDWRGTYNSNLVGGAGGSGNYRGGAGGGGFCGGSGGAASNVILASNVGGGGGGSSFISNKFNYQLNTDIETLLIGRENSESGGQLHLLYLDEIDDQYLSDLNISFARTPFFTVNDVYAVNRVYDDFGNYEDIEYTVKTEANPDGKITYSAVDYSATNIQTLKFDLPNVSLTPTKSGYERDRLTLTVTLAPKADFAGGNNVPLFVDDIISCTPSDTNYPAGEVNLKNQCGYVNVPLNFDVAAVNHTPQGLNPEDVVHKVSSLYVDKYQDVRSDPDADWRFHFIESIGYHVVKDSKGNVITADSVSPDETTRYIVELTVIPKQPSGRIYAKLGDLVAEKTFEEISIITVAGSGMDTLNGNVVVYNKALVYDEVSDTYILSLMIDSDSSGSISDFTKLPTFNDVSYGGSDASIGRESTVTIPITGKYTITVKGGDGGKGGSSSIIANNGGAGGVGGNISATFYLEAGTPLKFYAGANASDATQARAGASGGEYSYVAVLDSVTSGQISYYLMIASGGGGGGGGVILGRGDDGASPTEISNTYLGSISSYIGGSGSDSGWTGGNGGSAASNYVYNGTSDDRITLAESSVISESAEKGGNGSMECIGLGSGNGSMDELKGYTIETAISKYFTVKDVTLDVAYGDKTGFEYDIIENLSGGNLEYTKVTSVISLDPAKIDPSTNDLLIKEDIYKVHYSVNIILEARDGFLGGNDVLLLYLNDTEMPTGMKISQKNLQATDPSLDDFINADESRTTDYANVTIPESAIASILLETTDKIYLAGDPAIPKNTLVSSLTGLPDLSSYSWEADYVRLLDPTLDTELLSPFTTTTYTIEAGLAPIKSDPYAAVCPAVDAVTVKSDATIQTDAKIIFDLFYIDASVGGVIKTEDTVEFSSHGHPSSDYSFVLTLRENDVGYHLPNEIVITVGDRILVSDIDYIYERVDDRVANVTVFKDVITSNVTVSAEACREAFKVTYVFQTAPGSQSYDTFFKQYHYAESITLEDDFAEAGKTLPSPYDHYDFVWDWGDGSQEPITSMPKQNVWVVGTYEPKEYNVIVNYLFVDDSVAYEKASVTLKYGESFTITSPIIDGFVADKATVSDTVTGDAEYTVRYISSSGKLNIFYLYKESGEEASAKYSAELGSGESFSVDSPVITGYTPDVSLVEGTMTSSGATYYVYYTANLYTITFDANGGSCAVSEKTVKFGEVLGYNAETSLYDGLPEPIRVGYTFVAWTINGIEVKEDTAVGEHMAGRTLVAKWKGDEYDLIIHYVYEDGTKAFASQNKKVEYGTDYSVNSPALRGHTPDITEVSGNMVAQNVVYTVTYVKNEYTLTINYLFSADNGKVTEPYFEVLKHGESYSVNSPSVGGYECLEPVVSGTIDISDVVVDVYYYSKAPDISVTISWGDLIFDFSHDDWDPETHDYPGDTYTPSSEESNKITITNNSSISINADFEFIPQEGFESITGYFTDAPDSTDTVNTVNVSKNKSDVVYLHIQGDMPDSAKSPGHVMVGSCKVTIRGGQNK